ncbi:MAG: glycosyltransferase family protein, partial [Polyangiaceae bacterium]
MRILYGVVGEGMGHAMRSRVVLEHLTGSREHDVSILASGRAVDYLQKRFGDAAGEAARSATVKRIHGLHIIYEENRVRRSK